MVKATWDKKTMDLLYEVKSKNPNLSWKEIGHLVGKSPSQCYQKFKRSLDPKHKRGHWSHHDTVCLVLVVLIAMERNCAINWCGVEKYISHKSTKTLKDRWYKYSDPSLVHVSNFELSPIEIDFLEAQYKTVHNQWTILTKKLNKMIATKPSGEWSELNTRMQESLSSELERLEEDLRQAQSSRLPAFPREIRAILEDHIRTPQRSVEDIQKYFKTQSEDYIPNKNIGRISATRIDSTRLISQVQDVPQEYQEPNQRVSESWMQMTVMETTCPHANLNMWSPQNPQVETPCQIGPVDELLDMIAFPSQETQEIISSPTPPLEYYCDSLTMI